MNHTTHTMKRIVSLTLQLVVPAILVGLYFFFVLAGNVDFLGSLVAFGIGLYAGILVLYLDEKWLHTYYEDRPGKLLTRSLLFLLAFPLIGMYVTTSSGSSLGQGLILGMGVSILAEMYGYQASSTAFKDRFLWQLKKEVTAKDVRNIFLMSVGVFAALVYLVFR